MIIDGRYRPEICAGVSPDAVHNGSEAVFGTSTNARSDC